MWNAVGFACFRKRLNAGAVRREQQANAEMEAVLLDYIQRFGLTPCARAFYIDRHSGKNVANRSPVKSKQSKSLM